MLRAVLNSLPEDIKVEKVVLDFERATWKALREVLSTVTYCESPGMCFPLDPSGVAQGAGDRIASCLHQ